MEFIENDEIFINDENVLSLNDSLITTGTIPLTFSSEIQLGDELNDVLQQRHEQVIIYYSNKFINCNKVKLCFKHT